MKRPSDQRRKLPPELEAFARSDDEKLRIRRPRTDQGRVRDPREGYTVAGVSNRDARAVYDVRTEAMRALWAEGQADEGALAALGELFHDALRLELWHARRLTSFAALAEEVVGVPAAQAEALAEAFAERSGEPLTPLTERAIALWLRTEAGLYEGDEQARARIRSEAGTLVLELSVELVHLSTALAGAGARHLPLARSPREYEEGMRQALGERPERLAPEPLPERDTFPSGESAAPDEQAEGESAAPDEQAEGEGVGPLDELEAALPTESVSPAGARLLTRKAKPAAADDLAAEPRAVTEFGLRAPRPSAQGPGAARFGAGENERPRFGGDRGRGAGPDERSRFGNDRASHERTSGGGRRDERPRFGEERARGGGAGDERPRFAGRGAAGGRDERPRFGGDRAAGAGREQPRFGGGERPRSGRDERPRFGGGGSAGKRDERPRFGGGGFAGKRDERPRSGGGGFAGGRDERPRFGADRGAAGSRDERPRFGANRGAAGARSDERPRFGGGRDDRPRFGGDRGRSGSARDERPRFGGDRGFAGGGARDERPGGAGGRGRAGARDERPRFGGERPRQGGFVDRGNDGPVSRFGGKGKPAKPGQGFGARELLPRGPRAQESGPGEGATRAEVPRGRDDDDSFE